jgi:catechol 2,3-dioxygenase-like lactoylglutathione lyase family enzyme
MMDFINGYGYLTLGVPDIDASAAFYQQVCRLAITERRPGVIHLSGDANHHWLTLVEHETTELLRVGYKAVSRTAITEARKRLADRGIDIVTREGTDDDQVSGGFTFRDPAGLEFDLYEEMQQLGSALTDPDVGFTCNLHAVIFVPDPIGLAQFYREVLGFQRSDQIADIVIFLRAANNFHHALAFARGPRLSLDHFCVLVNGVDELMRLRAHIISEGVLGDDLVRHAASGSMSVYARNDLNGCGVEFCTGHAVITDDGYQGRLLKPGPTTVNMWARPFPRLAVTPAPGAPVAGTTLAPGTQAAVLASRSN